MKKLTNREITALASTLVPKAVEFKVPAEVTKLVKRKLKAWHISADARVLARYNIQLPLKDVVDEITYEEIEYYVLSWSQLNESVRIEINIPTIKEVYAYIHHRVIASHVNLYEIENTIVLAQIESKDLDSLLTTVKEKLGI